MHTSHFVECSLFSSAFKKIILNNTTPTFQEVDPSYFVDCITSHGIASTITRLNDFFHGNFTFLFATIFIWNDPESQLIMPHGKILKTYLSFVLVYNIYLGFNTKSKKCAWQKKTHRRAFLNYSQLYIFKICALWHAIFSRKNNALLCFLNGFNKFILVY